MPSRSGRSRSTRRGSTSSSLYIGMTTDNSGTMRSRVRPPMGCACHVAVPRAVPAVPAAPPVACRRDLPAPDHPSGRGMPPGGLAPGTPVAGRFTKWGGGRHWEWVGRYLGRRRARSLVVRAGRARAACAPAWSSSRPSGWVSLVPHEGAYAVGFYPAHREISVYVDMTTEPVWQRRDADDGGPEWEVTMVDLDLDVVLTREGHLFVDDEDEFAEHRVSSATRPRWSRSPSAGATSSSRPWLAGDEPFATVGPRVAAARGAAERLPRRRTAGRGRPVGRHTTLGGHALRRPGRAGARLGACLIVSSHSSPRGRKPHASFPCR